MNGEGRHVMQSLSAEVPWTLMPEVIGFGR
jgi:hypothetical protein